MAELSLVHNADQLSLRDAALLYASRGWRVLPITENAKSPPLINKWQIQATDDTSQIKKWWDKWPDANIGIATGRETGIFVVDIDPKNGGDETIAALLKKNSFPETATVRTGSGGSHVLFKCDKAIKSSNGKTLGQGVDLKAEGGYIVAARSIHPNGNQYAWIDSKSIAEPPEWLMELIDSPTKTKGVILKNVGFIPEGQRNNELYRRGCSLRGKGTAQSEMAREIHRSNRHDCERPLPDAEVNQIIASIEAFINIGKPPLFRYRDHIRSAAVPNDPSLRHVLTELSLWMDMEGNRCYPTQEQLAEKTALSRKTINKKLKLAERLGLIEIPKHTSANQKWANNVYILPRGFVNHV
ncbi:MAG: hypothetical protein DHS20C13_28000 [Thermodesulfobacteriota bacterium]|nr:MAG: hypothetical protein DHS20C13_28000 [Thermodesulfobacteriota bacterium]